MPKCSSTRRLIGIALGISLLGSVDVARAQSSQRLEPGRVLVLPIAAVDVPAAVAAQATPWVGGAIVRHGEGWSVVTLDDLQGALDSDQRAALSSCGSVGTCLARAGRLSKAAYVISGSIGMVGLNLTINLSLIDVASETPRDRVSAVVASAQDLRQQVASLIGQLFGWQTSGVAQAFAMDNTRPPSFAVLDLTPTGVSAEIAKNLTTLLTDELKKIDGVSVIGSDDIVAMLQFESNKQMLGCGDDSSCLAEVGGALGVSYLVAGNVGKMAETWVISLRLMSPMEGEVANRVTESFTGLEEQLPGALRHAARRLVGLRGEEAGDLLLTATDKAKVYVDGADVGTLPIETLTQLSSGRHDVRMTADDYLEWQSDVYVQPGTQTAVRAKLLPIPRAWYESWIFWTVAGGVAAVAAGTTIAVVTLGGNNQPTTANFGGLDIGLPER